MEMKGLEIRMQIIMLHCGAVALWGRAFYTMDEIGKVP